MKNGKIRLIAMLAILAIIPNEGKSSSCGECVENTCAEAVYPDELNELQTRGLGEVYLIARTVDVNDLAVLVQQCDLSNPLVECNDNVGFEPRCFVIYSWPSLEDFDDRINETLGSVVIMTCS